MGRTRVAADVDIPQRVNRNSRGNVIPRSTHQDREDNCIRSRCEFHDEDIACHGWVPAAVVVTQRTGSNGKAGHEVVPAM